MNESSILSDDEPYSMPSMPTQWGGDPAVLGRIDHYDILRKLGGGGFGVVYLARDTASGVEVAIKTLHPLLKHNAEEMDLLREKFRLVSRLSHPNIATALVLHPCRDINIRDEAVRREFRLSPGDNVMVMRYAPGVTLSKWRRQFPDGIVPFDLALEVGRQVADALDYAHGERIVHRDVKPGNIMVETLEGGGIRARILDFGLAAEIRSSMSRVSTEQGDTSGTRPYMAPEQWLGRKQDGRTDQYALACVLYELLSGAPPFAGVFETGDPVIMRTAVTTDAPEEIESLPNITNAALLRALAKDPKERFKTCTAFLCALVSGEESIKEVAVHKRGIVPGIEKRHSEIESPNDATNEADALRRKVALVQRIVEIPADDRSHELFGPLIKEIETELSVAEEAFKWGRFSAAVQCLDRAENTFNRLQQSREEEANRIRLEQEEQQRRLAEEKERVRAEAERRRIEEARRRAEDERRQAEAQAEQEERERLAREEAQRQWARRQKVRDELERVRREAAETKKSAQKATFHKYRLRIGQFVGIVAICFVAQWLGLAVLKHRHRVHVIQELIDNMVQCPFVATNFWVGKFEVTQKEWVALMGQNPSHFAGSDNPVECVSWNDCQAYINKLNTTKTVKQNGLVFRLPTDQEWSAACRADAPKDQEYCKSIDGIQITPAILDQVAQYGSGKTNSGTFQVGKKKPNSWGLYDMHGNVCEWTSSSVGSNQIILGGCFRDFADHCSADYQFWTNPRHTGNYIGFRLVATSGPATTTER